jgi:DnaK suppressor protein
MKDSQREDLRRRLEARAREILHQSHLTASAAATGPEPRDNVPDAPELALDDAIKTAAADFTDRDRAVLVEIRDAFARMRDGGYGACIDCGEAIPLARLKSIPWASRCADDQERQEQSEPTAGPTL